MALLGLESRCYPYKTTASFYGNYFAAAPIPLKQDTLVTLKHDDFLNASVSIMTDFNVWTNHTGIYNFDALDTFDPYSVFLYHTLVLNNSFMLK